MNEPLRQLPAWLGAFSLGMLAVSCIGGSRVESPLDVNELRAEVSPVTDAAPRGEPALVCDRAIDDFLTSALDGLPRGWQTWQQADLERARRERTFEVATGGGAHFLRVRPTSDALTLGRGVEAWNIERHPVLRWKWRVRGTAPGTAADRAALEVVWLVGLPFVVRRLEYVWSAGELPGTRSSSRFGQDQRVVLEAGQHEVWRTAEVDVRRHYARLFDADEVPAPTGIAITAPKAGAVTDYAELELCRRMEPLS